eukprot:TRINITY_DN239_c0_g1_i4.p1 TRINITY_DN239_c0_g1~~TRINITY_DN239_c0_g1_i4.p1  ORF type:complete len:770 (-),score=110.84 TRINITY_DN239_c0_g1_i4:162-2471(-)
MALGKTSGTRSVVGNSRIVICLLGATILYQIAYHVAMHRALIDSERFETGCDAGRFANSLQCVEIDLFRSWNNAELHDRLSDAQPSVPVRNAVSEAVKIRSQVRVENLEPIVIDNTASKDGATKWRRIVPWGKLERLYSHTLASIQKKSSITPWAKNIQASQAALESRMDALPSSKLRQLEERQRKFDMLYNQTLASIRDRSNVTSWSTELEAIQKRFDHWMRNAGSAGSIHVDFQREFDKLYNETLTSLNESSVTQWTKDIEASQTALERGMESLRSKRFRKREEWEMDFDRLYYQTLASIQNRSNVTSWGRELEAIQKRFEHRMRTSKKSDVIKERDFHRLYQDKFASLHNGSSASSELGDHLGSSRWHFDQEATLLEQIYNFGREMCALPERSDVPACKRFIPTGKGSSSVGASARGLSASFKFGAELAEHNAALNLSLSMLRADHDSWFLNFSQTVDNFTTELCADPRRKNYRACARFLDDDSMVSALESGRAVDGVNRPALRGGRGGAERISWSAVVAASQKNIHKAEERAVLAVTSDNLYEAKWQAKIPKVACITAVPVGRDSRVRFAEFLNEFREQTYEGSRELVLVYSHSDAETADIVRANADGTYIKAVAARDGLDPLSTVALRYGAWSSDAEVVASWRFDESHHPDRLAMQVRALGLAARPVSILKRVKLLSDNGDGLFENVLSADPGWEGSLVGEKSWMQRNWMPLLGNERGIFHSSFAGQLVQVDMPELSMYTARGPHALADAVHHFGMLSTDLLFT